MNTISKLTVLAIFLSILISGCEKDDPIGQTFKEQYPEWVSLTWMATESNTSLDTYPKLHISIDGNTVTVEQELSTGGRIDEFTSMTVTYDEDDGYPSGTVTFSNNDLILVAEFEITYNDLHPDDYDFNEFDYLVIYPLSGFEDEILGMEDIEFKMN